MPKRVTVVISQSQSKNPAKRKLEEDLVAALLAERGVEVTVVPHLYDLAPDGTGMLCLQGIGGDMIVCAWLFPRAARWTLDRNGIRGREGASLLPALGEGDDGDDDDDVEDELNEEEQGKQRVIDTRELPARKIYCLDLRAHEKAEPYLEEIRRIAQESTTQTVDLMNWIGGKPQPEQLNRYLNPSSDGGENGNGRDAGGNGRAEPAGPIKLAGGEASVPVEPTIVDEKPLRRWYPVIDYSRCTNCMECVDFCLFGVYGVDRVDTILVEQPDNCRKGCPACSRVCPENAIIFPQHKTPTIAGSLEKSGGIKIDLSQLFGAPDPGAPGAPDAVEIAARERDEQLLLAGRDAVGMSVGIPKRQADKDSEAEPRDELDDLIDELDDLEL